MAKPDERAAILKPAFDGAEGIALEHFDHIRRVNDVVYDQVKLSDQKAVYIFTFMLALLVTPTESRAVFIWSRYVEGHWTSRSARRLSA